MEHEKIIEDLNRRFAMPLPEFYKRRIVFWLDDDGEYADKIEEISLLEAKVIALTGSNTFAMKKLITVDDTSSNFLVYRPFSIEDEDNWLLNVELYSEEYRSDLISSYIDELHLSASPTIRKCIKCYRKFLNAKDRRRKLASLIEKHNITTPSGVEFGIMATICNQSEIQLNGIMKAVLMSGLHIDENEVFNEFKNYDIAGVFVEIMAKFTGYHDEIMDMSRFASHVLVTAATTTMREEHFAGLENYYSIPHQSNCYDFVSEWLNSDEAIELYDIARVVEDELRLVKRFEQIPLVDIADTEVFPCMNEIILAKLMTDIQNHLIDVDTIITMVEKRRTMAWADTVSCYWDAILQVANMQTFYKENVASFHTIEAKSVWTLYTEQYYKMDSYYRWYHLAFSNSLIESIPELDDLLKHVTEVVEGLYTNWFLGQLGENWTSASEEELKEYGFVHEISRQKNFYRDKIESSDTRVFVIISDALRYEVAATLSEELKRDAQAKIELQSRQGIFPTTTKFGMAALLPHKELTAEMRKDKLTVLADGSLTESAYRDKVLKERNKESVALQYKNVIQMKRAERNELVKGKEVVYIYHNTIDEASHNSDTAIFSACENAIAELKNLIRIIINDFSGTRIMITSDHGFLYTYNPLQENDKVDKAGFEKRVLEYGRRYAILEKGNTPDYLMPVKFISDAYDGYAPRESIRIKMSGGGMNFVHGGTSLQEMVIPVIEYHHLRNSSKEYLRNKQKYDTEPVTLNLLSASKKISNMIFSLNFYQKEAVSDNRKAANYLLYFEDANGTQVSNTQKIIADKTSDNGQDRTFRCKFNLKSMKYSKAEAYYLVIAEEGGVSMPQREEFVINIAISVDDLGL